MTDYKGIMVINFVFDFWAKTILTKFKMTLYKREMMWFKISLIQPNSQNYDAIIIIVMGMHHQSIDPTNTTPVVVWMLGQRLRRYPNIKTTTRQRRAIALNRSRFCFWWHTLVDGWPFVDRVLLMLYPNNNRRPLRQISGMHSMWQADNQVGIFRGLT